MPGYREPAWSSRPGIDSHHVAHTLTATPVGDLDVAVWSPADAKLGERNIAAVPGLRGIARTYRLAYLYGETEESAQSASTLQDQLAPTMMTRVVTTPSSEGERALRNALDRLNASSEAKAAQRARCAKS